MTEPEFFERISDAARRLAQSGNEPPFCARCNHGDVAALASYAGAVVQDGEIVVFTACGRVHAKADPGVQPGDIDVSTYGRGLQNLYARADDILRRQFAVANEMAPITPALSPAWFAQREEERRRFRTMPRDLVPPAAPDAWHSLTGCKVCGGTLYYEARQRGDGLCSPRCRDWYRAIQVRNMEATGLIDADLARELMAAPNAPIETFSVGDRVVWEPDARSPLGGMRIEGDVAEIDGSGRVRLLKADELHGDCTWRVSRGLLDVTIAPGTIRHIERAPTDPLDAVIDGVTLRDLVRRDEIIQRGEAPEYRRDWTPAQRAAVSAHWSAELRAKVAASKERERTRVVVDLEDE